MWKTLLEHVNLCGYQFLVPLPPKNSIGCVASKQITVLTARLKQDKVLCETVSPSGACPAWEKGLGFQETCPWFWVPRYHSAALDTGDNWHHEEATGGSLVGSD